MNTKECITLQMEIITKGLQYTVDALKQALRNGDTPAALVVACSELKDIEESVRGLYQDYAETLPPAELAARKAAAGYMQVNAAPWDRDETADTDPLALQVSTDDIADQIAELFGDDAPADIIKALKAC